MRTNTKRTKEDYLQCFMSSMKKSQQDEVLNKAEEELR